MQNNQQVLLLSTVLSKQPSKERETVTGFSQPETFWAMGLAGQNMHSFSMATSQTLSWIRIRDNFLSSLYILDISPLSDLGLVKILSQSGGLFVLLTVSFALQKLCNFMRSHLSILDLTAQAIAVLFRNFFPLCPYLRGFSPLSPLYVSVSLLLCGASWST